MNIQIIKHRVTEEILFEGEYDSLKLAVEDAVKRKVSLRGAVLTGSDLRGAVLRDADLTDAYLRDADLTGSDLTSTDLDGSDLAGSNLRGAVLADAYLCGAGLYGAKGIVSFGPCPGAGRIGYVIAGDPPMVHLGCFWGTRDKAATAINEKYPDKRGVAYIGLIDAALAVLEVRQ